MEDLLKKIEFERFMVLLKETVESGFGEINYKLTIQNNRIEVITITKMNTYKPESVKI